MIYFLMEEIIDLKDLQNDLLYYAVFPPIPITNSGIIRPIDVTNYLPNYPLTMKKLGLSIDIYQDGCSGIVTPE